MGLDFALNVAPSRTRQDPGLIQVVDPFLAAPLIGTGTDPDGAEPVQLQCFLKDGSAHRGARVGHCEYVRQGRSPARLA